MNNNEIFNFTWTGINTKIEIFLSEFQKFPKFHGPTSKTFLCKISALVWNPNEFFDIFSKQKFSFSENSEANSEKLQIWVRSFMCQLAKHIHAKFQLSGFYPDGLRQIFDIFYQNLSNLAILHKFKNVFFFFWLLSFHKRFQIFEILSISINPFFISPNM
jgi:hypothetical protein